MTQKFPRLFLILLAALLFLNLIQSYFTELIYDEAYYWYYAKELSWGYFDHPPMVAFLIKLSSFFFNGELGVRFMSCLLSAGTYVVLWSLIDNPKKKDYVVHFFLLVFSMTLMNAYGFLTLPDTPLLFFTSVFLWLYKRFLEKPSLAITFALGAVMAALMYSKYHAFLVIFFVFLSNIKLIKNGKAWVAVVVALALYAPHFHWLYQNDLVSIKYHLYERPNQPYSFSKFTLGYVVNLIAIFGLLFYWMYYALIKTKASNGFIKALKYLSWGVIIFFFISSFNRRVQTQWIIVITIPMVVLAFHHLIDNGKSRKWMYRLGIISFVLMMYTRAWLVYKPLLPILFETHGNIAWVNELKEKSGGVPIVFENSYRRAPMYEFYSGISSLSLNNYMYRKNQYSIDDTEESVRKKRILYSTKYRSSGDLSYSHLDGTLFYGIFIDDFESFRKLACIVEEQECPNCYSLQVFNPYGFDVPVKDLSFSVAFSNTHKQVQKITPIKVEQVSPQVGHIASKDTLSLKFVLPKPKNPDISYFRIGISENGLPPGLNGKPVKLKP